MTMEKGSISINTDNILPIIKKWLYSDKDIFIRELISNSADALSKYKRLMELEEVKKGEEEKLFITVTVNKKQKTLTFSDNGIGMTGEEVRKYINQIAFSGAQDFLEKYKDENAKDQIIGHFGLGFYSAFMVAEKVEIQTLSYTDGAQPVRWESDGTSEYAMEPGIRSTRGTDVILHIMKEEKEFLDIYKVRSVVRKYCGFLPFEIYVKDEVKPEEKEGEAVNETSPLWLKKPSECTDEDYRKFYRKTFMDYNEPLFWIHLNMEYPFRLKGILFFPKLKHELESMEGRIQLYYNQVYVADNIKEVIPEFLMLLKGVIDCPDLPLNVSRSFLQNDGYVNKISNHITKKVSDKLKELFNKQREDYNRYWDDINPFVKYGCLREEKFYEKVKGFILYKTIDDKYVTLEDYLAKNMDKHTNKVYYASDTEKQAPYITLFKEHGLDAVVLNAVLDSHFISFIEGKNPDLRFESVDSNISEILKGEELAEGLDDLKEYFKKVLGEGSMKIEAESLKAEQVPAILVTSEESRRMQEMSRMFGGGSMPSEEKLVLNASNGVIRRLSGLADGPGKEDAVRHIYQLALLSAGRLKSSDLSDFIRRSSAILEAFTTDQDKEGDGE
ncbi:MAG: molecular chaperone HtpG [Clostridia bacterium]